jgi:hypothetical protein
MSNIVKVRYFSETTGELRAREYTYFSEESLQVGDIITVPVRDTFAKAKVSAINVPESEIAAFRDKVKTIPARAENLSEFGSPTFQAAMREPDPTPGTDIEVIEWHRQGIGLQEYAESRVIKGLGDLKSANDDLTIIARLKKVMEDRRKQYVQPLNVQVKAINDNYKQLMQPVLEAERITKQKMLDFNAEQERIRREQEAVNRLRMEAAQKEAALNEGEISEPVKMVEVIAEAPRRVSTDMGSSGMRDNWTFEITDFAALPDDYKLANTAALNAFAKSTKGARQIPGVRIFNQPIIATRVK